jgi:PAS domain S-box-containing protein
MRIREQLLTAFVPLILISAGAVGALALRASYRLTVESEEVVAKVFSLRMTAERSLREMTSLLDESRRRDYEYLARQVAATLDLSHDYLRKEASSAASSALIAHYLQANTAGREFLQPQVVRHLHGMAVQFDLDGACLYDAAGAVLVPSHQEAYPGPGGQEPVCCPWLRKSLGDLRRSPRTALLVPGSDSHAAAPDRGPLLAIGVPIRSRPGRGEPDGGSPDAFLVVRMSLERFCKPVLAIEGLARAALTLEGAGRILFRHVEGEPPPLAGPVPDLPSAETRALDGQLCIRVAAIEAPVNETATAMASLTRDSAAQSVRLDRLARMMERNVGAFRHRFAVTVVAALLLGTVVSIYLARRLTQPLVRLSASAGRIADGRLDEPLRTDSSNEIGDLARSVDRMRDGLKDLIDNLDRKVAEKSRALAENIEAQRRVEESLRESEEAFRRLFTEMADGFALHEIVTDAEGRPVDYRYLAINPSFERLTGLTADAVVGRTVREVLPGIESKWIETYGRVALTGEPAHFEEYAAALDRWYDVRAYSPAKGRFAAVFADVTERRRTEAEKRRMEQQMLQVQKLESLGVLAGGIAHDFNNLLMTILGNADLALADLPEHSAARESLSDIVRASRRAADLCRQMLAYSGKGRFCVEPVNLNDLIEEMAHLLVVSISKKVTLQCRFADNLPYVDGDATQLRQIVMNLITNASEAIEAEAGVVALATGIEDCGPDGPAGTVAPERLPGGPYVYVEVRDTGCGMEPETLARIFDPFFTTKFTGRGLGLAAVLGIVRGHKGAIRVTSEPGQGTTFRVLLPASTRVRPPEPEPDTARTASAPRVTGAILLVDDEPGVREVAGRMLASAGFEVAVAASGAEAVDIVREAPERIACVLLDLTMPQLDGEETLVRLRAVRGDLPVVISSGYSEQEIVRRFAGRNLAGFIQKPYVRAQLVSILRDVASRLSGGAQAAGGTGAPPAV